MARPRITLPSPPKFPPFPAWARADSPPKTPEDAVFLAGAALAALHPIARSEHPLAGLWRQRLALLDAASLAQRAGRREDEAALRDAWYLRRDGDDPGPAGRTLRAWRVLADPAALRDEDWLLTLSAQFELRIDAGLETLVATAARLAGGRAPRSQPPPRSPPLLCGCGPTPNRSPSGWPRPSSPGVCDGRRPYR